MIARQIDLKDAAGKTLKGVVYGQPGCDVVAVSFSDGTFSCVGYDGEMNTDSAFMHTSFPEKKLIAAGIIDEHYREEWAEECRRNDREAKERAERREWEEYVRLKNKFEFGGA